MKTLCVLLLTVVSAYGQGGTSFQLLFSNSTTPPQMSNPVRNGASATFHELVVFAKDNTPGSCNVNTGHGWTGDVHLEGSTNNINWFRFGTNITQAQTDNGTFVSAAGAFQYIRGVYQYGNTTDCNITVYYGGAPNGQNTGSAPTGWFTDNFQFNRLLSVGFSGGQEIRVQTCSAPNLTPSIYGGIFSNEGGTDTVVSIHAVGETSAADTKFMSFMLKAGETHILSNANRPYGVSGGAFTTTEIVDLRIQSSAATTLTASPVARCEIWQ